jgi:hypothetical protein
VADTPDEAYRNTLVEWGKATEAGVTREANRLFVLNHERFKELSATSEGREAITSLLADSDAFVRSVAATHSLLWAPERAVAVLEALQRDAQLPWQVQVSAEYTLKEWRAGRLDLER